MIVQNVACLPLYFDRNNSRISLANDKVQGKIINSLLLYCGNGDISVISPFNNDHVVDIDPIGDFSMFINLNESNMKPIFNDVDLKNFISPFYPPEHVEYFINRRASFNHSFISYKNFNSPEKKLLLLYVAYQTRKFNKLKNEVNGSYSVVIRPENLIEDIPLSRYVDQTLVGKKIKRIISTQELDDVALGYLDIVGVNQERVENIPLPFLINSGKRNLHFDEIEIDFELSYLRVRNIGKLPEAGYQLTFIY